MWKCSIFLNEILKIVKTIHFDRYILPQFKKLKDEGGRDEGTGEEQVLEKRNERVQEWLLHIQHKKTCKVRTIPKQED